MNIVKQIMGISLVGSLLLSNSTIDDLRWITGGDRITSEKIVNEIDTVKDIEYRNKSIRELEKILGEKEVEEKVNEVREVRESRDKHREEIKNKLSKGDSVSEILLEYRKYKEYADKIGDERDLILKDGSEDEKIEEDRINYIKELMKGIGDEYDIGDVGSKLEPITEGVFKAKNIFGKVYKDTITKEIESRDGLELCAGGELNTNIRVPWNGKIISVEKKNKKYTVRIKSGKTLYVEIEGIRGVEEEIEGIKVKQYDKLGYIKQGETVTLKVTLDGVYINPLRVYGNKGIKVYEEWVKENKDKVVDIEDMSNVREMREGDERNYEYGFYNILDKEEEEVKSKVIEDNGDSVDIEFDEDYEKPKNKIVE